MATRWPWPRASPATTPRLRDRAEPLRRGAARRVPGHRRGAAGAAALPVRRWAPGDRRRRSPAVDLRLARRERGQPRAIPRPTSPTMPLATAAASTGLTVSFRNGERILDAANALADGIPVRRARRGPLRAAPDREDPGRGRVRTARHCRRRGRLVAHEVARSAAAPACRGRRSPSWSAQRSQFPRLEEALREQRGALRGRRSRRAAPQPDVADVVATLRLLVDASAGNAAVRLLAGPRWRIGPATSTPWAGEPGGSRLLPPAATVLRTTGDPEPDVVDERSLVDALDDLGEPGAYSEEGYRGCGPCATSCAAFGARRRSRFPTWWSTWPARSTWTSRWRLGPASGPWTPRARGSAHRGRRGLRRVR